MQKEKLDQAHMFAVGGWEGWEHIISFNAVRMKGRNTFTFTAIVKVFFETRNPTGREENGVLCHITDGRT